MTWPPPSLRRDAVLIENLRVEAAAGPDCWNRQRPQPLLVSVSLEADVTKAARNDDLTDSPHYGKLAKDIVSAFSTQQERRLDCLEEVAEAVAKLAVAKLFDPSYRATVAVKASKLLLQDATVGIEIERTQGVDSGWGRHWKWIITDWRFPVLIGMNSPERKSKQIIIVNLELYASYDVSSIEARVLPTQLVDGLSQYAEATSFLTLEAFSTELIYAAMRQNAAIQACHIKVSKPSAITNADFSALEITRIRPTDL